jgi:hypothetical protein
MEQNEKHNKTCPLKAADGAVFTLRNLLIAQP